MRTQCTSRDHNTSMSRNWHLYGTRRATLLVVKAAWQKAVELSVESECPYEAELNQTIGD
eukprot:11183456-Lingulodinium_polyedra.AAC.1